MSNERNEKEVILQLQDVSKIYETVNALSEINLNVHRGEWVSIMGPSGSGKTTMINMIGAMDTPSLGKIILDGEEIQDMKAKDLTIMRRDKIGLIFQQFHLINYLTAVENVMVSQYYHSMPDEQEAIEALKKVGLGDRIHHLPHQLSGGEQQRVCIARALINSPAILLADEPTGNLDEENEQIVIDLMKQLHKEGVTIIVVTHDPEVGDEAQRKIVLNHGRIVEDINLEEGRLHEN